MGVTFPLDAGKIEWFVAVITRAIARATRGFLIDSGEKSSCFSVQDCLHSRINFIPCRLLEDNLVRFLMDVKELKLGILQFSLLDVIWLLFILFVCNVSLY